MNILKYSIGNSTVEYYEDKILKGILVTRLPITNDTPGKKTWLKFLKAHPDEDIYMSPTDVGIIKNHVKFFGTFGKMKVYKYVR